MDVLSIVVVVCCVGVVSIWCCKQIQPIAIWRLAKDGVRTQVKIEKDGFELCQIENDVFIGPGSGHK